MTHRLIDGIGLWRECLDTPLSRYKAAVFLDRDGVVVEETHYLSRAEDVRIVPGTAAAIRELNAHHVPVIIVTNQSGIGLGLYGWAAFEEVQRTILAGLEREGAKISTVLACAYHEAAEQPYRIANHPWRKPNPGMLLAAAEVTGCDLGRSVIVGDRRSDLEAGTNAGLRRGILVETGYGLSHAAGLRERPVPGMNTAVAPDAQAAIHSLFAEGWNFV